MDCHLKRWAIHCLFICAAVSHSAIGGDLEITPRVYTTLGYNDNLRLQPDVSNPGSTTYLSASIRADIEQRSADISLSFSPEIKRVEYAAKEFQDLDATEYFLNGSVEKYLSRGQIGSTFRFVNQTVISSEDSDPEDPNLNASANFLNRDNRIENLTVSPYLSWSLSPADVLTFTTSFSRVDHIKKFGPLVDYTAMQAGIIYRHTLDERHSIGIEASAGRTDTVGRSRYCLLPGAISDDFKACVGGSGFLIGFGPYPGEWAITTTIEEQEIDSYTGFVTYEYKPSEQLVVSAKYGRQKTDLYQLSRSWNRLTREFLGMPDFVAEDLPVYSSFETDTYLFNIGYKQQRTDWLFEVTRDVRPSNGGDPLDKTQARAVLVHQLAPRLSVSLTAIAYQQEQRTTAAQYKNKYVRADASLVWQVTRNLSTDFIYIYRNRKPVLESSVFALTQGMERKSNNFITTVRYRF